MPTHSLENYHGRLDHIENRLWMERLCSWLKYEILKSFNLLPFLAGLISKLPKYGKLSIEFSLLFGKSSTAFL